MFPSRENLTICFAHAAYQMQERFDVRKTGIRNFQAGPTTTGEAGRRGRRGRGLGHVEERSVRRAAKLKFIQSISAGTDQFSREVSGARRHPPGQRAGVNARAVAEHAMALILALSAAASRGARQSGASAVARHDRRSHRARGRARRQDAADRRPRPYRQPSRRLAKAFDMQVVGIRRDPCAGPARPMRFTPSSASPSCCRGRFRRAHLPADAGDRQPDRRRGARAHEAVGCIWSTSRAAGASTRRR